MTRWASNSLSVLGLCAPVSPSVPSSNVGAIKDLSRLQPLTIDVRHTRTHKSSTPSDIGTPDWVTNLSMETKTSRLIKINNSKLGISLCHNKKTATLSLFQDLLEWRSTVGSLLELEQKVVSLIPGTGSTLTHKTGWGVSYKECLINLKGWVYLKVGHNTNKNLTFFSDDLTTDLLDSWKNSLRIYPVFKTLVPPFAKNYQRRPKKSDTNALFNNNFNY